MSDLDTEGLAVRGGVGGKKAKRNKRNFSSKGPNWVHSLGGYDKLMRFQNSTSLLAILMWFLGYSQQKAAVVASLE